MSEPETPAASTCRHCGQFAHHPLHTGKNSQTGEDEQPIDHAFEAEDGSRADAGEK